MFPAGEARTQVIVCLPPPAAPDEGDVPAAVAYIVQFDRDDEAHKELSLEAIELGEVLVHSHGMLGRPGSSTLPAKGMFVGYTRSRNNAAAAAGKPSAVLHVKHTADPAFRLVLSLDDAALANGGDVCPDSLWGSSANTVGGRGQFKARVTSAPVRLLHVTHTGDPDLRLTIHIADVTDGCARLQHGSSTQDGPVAVTKSSWRPLRWMARLMAHRVCM